MTSRQASLDDQIHAALKAAIEVEEHAYLWHPDDGIDFVPAVSSTIFGDGRALLALTTINSRPAYYVIRIDSTWNVEDYRAPRDAVDVREFVGDIACALEDEFGDGRSREDEEDEEGEMEDLEWPAFDGDNGCSWGRMDWPVGIPAEMDRHPFARYSILSAFRVPSEPAEPAAPAAVQIPALPLYRVAPATMELLGL